MKILILANNDVGLYQFRKELIEALLQEHKIYISLPNGDLVQPLVEAGCHFIDTPVDRRGVNPKTDFRLLLAYHRMIKHIKPDLVITYTIKPNVYGGLVCRLTKTKYAVNITGLGTAFQKRGLLKTFVICLYKIGLKKANVVFFENVENQNVFVNSHIVKRDKTVLLSGAGVNLEKYTLLPYPTGNEIQFLFIGRVMKEKGVDELFEAMKLLAADGMNCKLNVVGGCEEDYENVLKEHEKSGWLQYHGYQKDVRPFIKGAHCFVLPSWHEGMANTNLECAASGRPVITSKIHGCMEAVEDNVSGYLCEKQNANDLYKKMKAFLNLSADEKQNMGLAGRKRMEQIFDKKKVVETTINALQMKEK